MNEYACRKRSAPVEGAEHNDRLIESITSELQRRFGHCAEHRDLAQLARVAVDEFASAPVRNYVPILARKHAVEAAERQCSDL